MSNKKAAAYSDNFFYGSMPLPVLLMLDKKIRRDAGKIAFLYLEAFAITGVFYTGSVYFVDRYRPEAYVDTNKIPVNELTSGNYKDAFIGGHPAVVATATFFTAKVFADYNPQSNWRYAFYGAAIAATGTTAYLRHLAGKHFPSDLVLGTTVGVLSGILVPHFHKNKKLKDNKIGLAPYINGDARGLTLYYAFK
jgi:membrane-associated phospholipid phosphatase